MACSVEVNCLGALAGNAHHTKGVLNSLELVLGAEEGDLMLSLHSLQLLGLIPTSCHKLHLYVCFCAH